MENIWTAIAITASGPRQAKAYQSELHRLQQRGLLPESSLVLAVPDPSSERVGSGGATLNALLTIAEYLSARRGLSYIDPELVETSKILIIHSGGDSQRIPILSVCGKAFSVLPIQGEKGELVTPFLHLYGNLTRLAESVNSGLFIASGDVLLHLPEEKYDWNACGVTGLAIPADRSYAPHHGVYLLANDRKRVLSFFQKAPLEELEQKGAVRTDRTVLIDSGVIYFSGTLSKKILTLNVAPPLDSCTYLGVDSGASPLRIELYSDLLACMAEEVSKHSYLAMASTAQNKAALQQARELIWETLRGIPYYASVAENGRFVHLGTTTQYIHFFSTECKDRSPFPYQSVIHSLIEESVPNTVVLNSCLYSPVKVEENSVIEHSILRGNCHLGKGSLCSGIRSYHGIHVEDHTVVKEIQLRTTDGKDERRTVVIYGVLDRVNDSVENKSSTFMNRPWSVFFEKTGINPVWLWPTIPSEKRGLWNAKLYPILNPDDWIESVLWLQYDRSPSPTTFRKWLKSHRLSFEDLLLEADPLKELTWIRDIYHRIDLNHIESILIEKNDEFLLEEFYRCAQEKRFDLLNKLDQIALESTLPSAARIFMAIADTLHAFSKNEGGLRSGPMRNACWRKGLELLENNNISEAAIALSQERTNWLDSPERMIRAARHYEGAVQIIIRKSVETASIEYQSIDTTPMGEWIQATIPARIDLAGGWSDTPPITYEHGGAVANMAIRLDGEPPIGVRVRKIVEPIVRIRLDKYSEPVLCRHLSDFSDHCQPLAPAALCKAALIVMDVVSFHSTSQLEKQIEQIGGGIEIETWSNLPTGSGLGTSSILACVLIQSLGRLIGRKYDEQSLIHLVLRLEQVLTTGGGWQDQMGGLIPGIKIGYCSNQLPLKVCVERLPIPETYIQTLNEHFMLIYTGRTRLARNLLQDVIRRWYAKYPDIVDLVHDLIQNVETMKKALIQEDMEGIGRSLDCYWNQKKLIAGGAEPLLIRKVLETVRPYIFGGSLTGAGGGGFMVLIVKKPLYQDTIKQVLNEKFPDNPFSYHSVEIEQNGVVFL